MQTPVGENTQRSWHPRAPGQCEEQSGSASWGVGEWRPGRAPTTGEDSGFYSE